MEITGTTQPALGSVERYADYMRNHVRTHTELAAGRLDLIALTWIQVAAEDPALNDREQLARVRNVLTAAKLVADEIRQRDGS